MMIKNIGFLLHGFNVRDGGQKTTDVLKEVIFHQGWTPREFDYGHMRLFQVRDNVPHLANTLAQLSFRGDIAIGHSNGCNIINQACHMGAAFSHVIYIAPALDRNAKLARTVKRAYVFHSKNDFIVRVANLLFHHPWGDMGNFGYTGFDKRYRNVDCTTLVKKHSDYFKKGIFDQFTPMLEGVLNEIASFERTVGPSIG